MKAIKYLIILVAAAFFFKGVIKSLLKSYLFYNYQSEPGYQKLLSDKQLAEEIYINRIDTLNKEINDLRNAYKKLSGYYTPVSPNITIQLPPLSDFISDNYPQQKIPGRYSELKYYWIIKDKIIIGFPTEYCSDQGCDYIDSDIITYAYFLKNNNRWVIYNQNELCQQVDKEIFSPFLYCPK